MGLWLGFLCGFFIYCFVVFHMRIFVFYRHVSDDGFDTVALTCLLFLLFLVSLFYLGKGGNCMKPFGPRKIDDLGRIILPRQLRKLLNLKEGDSVAVYYVDNNTAILQVEKEKE